jgi:hypothetical protein
MKALSWSNQGSVRCHAPSPQVEHLALRGLGGDDPTVRLDALGAVHECVSLAIEQDRAVDLDVAAVAAALAPLARDPRLGSAEDPWASTWTWCLETLAMLAAPEGRAMALRALSVGGDRRQRLDALLALSRYPGDDEVLGVVTPLLDAKPPELRGAAALVMYLRGPASQRGRSEGVLLQRVLRPGSHDDDWEPIVEALRDDDAPVDHWIRAGEQTDDARVRGRVADALLVRVRARDDRGAELGALTARCGPRLAAALRRRWRDASA